MMTESRLSVQKMIHDGPELNICPTSDPYISGLKYFNLTGTTHFVSKNNY